MKTVTENDVRPIIRSVSIASGAISFVYAPLPGSDAPFFTALTLGMVTGIAGKFDYVNPIAGVLEAKRVISCDALRFAKASMSAEGNIRLMWLKGSNSDAAEVPLQVYSCHRLSSRKRGHESQQCQKVEMFRFWQEGS
jgi:hypothetical protein